MLVTIDIVGEQEESIFQLVIRDPWCVQEYGDKITGEEMGRFVRKWAEKRMDGEILEFLRMVLTPLQKYFEKIDRNDVSARLEQMHYTVASQMFRNDIACYLKKSGKEQ